MFVVTHTGTHLQAICGYLHSLPVLVYEYQSPLGIIFNADISPLLKIRSSINVIIRKLDLEGVVALDWACLLFPLSFLLFFSVLITSNFISLSGQDLIIYQYSN